MDLEKYYPLVDKLAGQFARRLPQHVEFDDLVQEGMLGLLDAAKRYDARNGEFTPFASARIRGAILDSLRRDDPVSRATRARGREIDQAEEILTNTLGRAPESDELAAAAGVTLAELYQVRLERESACGNPIISNDSDELDLMETLAEPEHPDLVEMRDRLEKCLCALDPRLMMVLELRYRYDMKTCEIAEAMGLTAGRISQLESLGLKAANRIGQ
jgi:RNA polymerase sigma factor for flagellar operon FliA